MPKLIHQIATLTLTALTLLAATGVSFAQTYAYTVIARSGQVIGGHTIYQFHPSVSLNNAGQVAYTASLGPLGFTGSGVFRNSSVVAVTGQVMVGGGIFFASNGGPWINNLGQVAYFADGKLFVDSTPAVTGGQSIGGQIVSVFDPPPFIDDAGALLFTGNHSTVFTTTSVLASGQAARRNNAGQVVYVTSDNRRINTIGLGGASYSAGSILDGKILTGAGGIDIDGNGGPSINNNGQIAFPASYMEGTTTKGGLFRLTFSGNPPTLTATNLVVRAGQSIQGLTIAGFGIGVSLNDTGTVAFVGLLDPIVPVDGIALVPGVFTQNGLVLRDGDTVGGKIVSYVNHPVINNSGQVASIVKFTDNTSAIVLATPSSAPPPNLQITSNSLTNATVGLPYGTNLAASGGSGSGYTWSIASGTLPAGFALSPAGVLSSTGTPPAIAGTYPITFRVTDSASGTVTKTLSLSVQPGIQITTTVLPAGVTGNAYRPFQLTATGGSGSFLWSLVSGALPPGYRFPSSGILTALDLNAAPSGRYALRVRATDATSSTTFGERDLVLYVLGTVTMLDPVPQLLSGPKVTSNRTLLATRGRPVKGIAADGIAQVVFRIPTVSPGDQVTATLLSNQCSDQQDFDTCTVSNSSDDNGGLFPVGTQVSSSQSLPSAQSSASDVFSGSAFVAYRAPVDFVRPQIQSDTTLAGRPVYVRFSYSSGGIVYATQITALTIVRPLVVLVHGFNSNAAAWDTFEPLFDRAAFRFRRVEYGDDFPYTSDQGVYAPPLPWTQRTQPKKSHFGLDYNGCSAIHQVNGFLREYRSGLLSFPVAAAAADVVAHSMGGLLIKYASQQSCYRGAENYNAGSVHKLITLGTPYFGTPQAVVQLASSSSCSQKIASVPLANTFSIRSFTPNGGAEIRGAVNDLQGTGTGVNLSDPLRVVNSLGARLIPTAVIAGDMNSYLTDVNNFNFLGGTYNICGPTTEVTYRDEHGLFSSDVSVKVRGYVTLVNGVLKRERGGDVTVPGTILRVGVPTIHDSYAFYLTTPRFLAQFDPNITSFGASGGRSQVLSDGSVPLTSGQGGYAATTILNNHLHSTGWESLVKSRAAFTSYMHLQNSSVAATHVQRFLNTTILSSEFNKR